MKRGLLRGTKFAKDSIDPKVWGVFSYLAQNPRYTCEFALEILESAKAGYINLDGNFNLPAYELVAKRYRKIKAFKNLAKEISADTPIGEEGDMTIVDTFAEIEDSYQRIEEDLCYKEAVEWFMSNRYFVEDYDECTMVDMHLLLAKALEGSYAMHTTLKRICDKSVKVATVIKQLLSNGLDDSLKGYLNSLVNINT